MLWEVTEIHDRNISKRKGLDTSILVAHTFKTIFTAESYDGQQFHDFPLVWSETTFDVVGAKTVWCE